MYCCNLISLHINITILLQIMSRRSSRERKPSSKLQDDNRSVSPVPVSPPKHPSEMPIDASIYGVGYLRRQMADELSHLVPHLDFVRLEPEAIKELFWTDYLERRHGEFKAPPKALQRNIKSINTFLYRGNIQKQLEIEKYKRFDEQIIKESNDTWDISKIIVAYESMAVEQTTCKGASFIDIEESKNMNQERKDEVKAGMSQLIRQSFSTKYNQTGSNGWSYCVPVTGAVVKGAKNEVTWLIEELLMSNVKNNGSTDGVTDFASTHTPLMKSISLDITPSVTSNVLVMPIQGDNVALVYNHERH